MRSGLTRIFLITLAGCFAAAAAIVADGLNDRLFHSDIIVVLGNKVERDGTPSRRLQARLDRALELYGQGWSPLIFVSGGTGKEGFDEAAVMADYLARRKIPRRAIVRDNQGVDTAATARNASVYMKARGLSSALIVSQYFHISRARLALQRTGIQKIASAHAKFIEPRDVYSVVREVVGYVVYYLK